MTAVAFAFDSLALTHKARRGATARAFDSLTLTHKARRGATARAFDSLTLTHKARRGATARAFDIVKALKVARSNVAYPVDFKVVAYNPRHSSYIAGTLDGIVTVAGQPAQKGIWCYAVTSASMTPAAQVWSLSNGNYLIPFLDPAMQYLIIARDDTNQYDPVGYDYITPDNTKTPLELSKLWQSIQPN